MTQHLPQSKLKIGNVELSGRVLLAPMAGITDSPFREICREYGAALTTSEMLTSDINLWHTPKSQWRLQWADNESPRCIQIAGSDSEKMAIAAKKCESLGADIIDINMGCPAKKVCKQWAGSALLQDEQKVARILESVVKAVHIPVTLKTRTGWDRSHKNILSVAHIAENSGIQAISIHGRTRADKYQGHAEYDSIACVKSQINIPVIANGDITNLKKAQQVLDLTNADGIMLGRGVQGRPWLLKIIDQYLQNDIIIPNPNLHSIKRLILRHLSLMHDFYGEETGIRMSRKHIGWYLESFEGGPTFKKKFNTICSTDGQLAGVQEYFERLIEGEVMAA